MKRIALAALFALATALVPAAFAETPPANPTADEATDMQTLREAMKTDKRAYVASVLSLTPVEAKRFWPIYDAYQRNLDQTSRRRVIALEGLMFRDKAMTNVAAKNLITELMAVDEAETKSRMRLRNRLMRVLPSVKAARYLQLEDKFQAVRDYDMATTVPLIH